MHRRALLAAAAAAAALPAVARAAAAPAASAPAPSAQGGAPATVGRWLDSVAQVDLDLSPETVSSLGLDKGDRAAARSLLDDRSLERRAARRDLAVQRLAALRRIPKGSYQGADALNDAIFESELQRQTDFDSRFNYSDGPVGPYAVDQQSGAYLSVPEFLDSAHVIETADDCHAYLARLNAFATALDQDGERTRHDAALGVFAPAFAIDKVLAQTRILHDAPLPEQSLVQSLVRRARERNIPGDWETAATAILRQSVLPALERQTAMFTGLRQSATADAGVWRLPDGDAYYAASLAAATTTRLSPAEVHARGVDLVAQLDGELDRVFRTVGMTTGTAGQRLHALFADPRFIVPDTDAGKAQLIADANARIAQVQAKLPQFFGVLPRAKVEVRRIPPAAELSASTHYQSASLDGSRPGIYWLSLRDTAETPTWDLWTTTYHEAIPGHHLQISIAQEADLPLARKLLGFGAYAEGWALYAEQLAAVEMDQYAEDPYGRLGYLHDCQLRAVRLVLDTGLHHGRWSRAQAIRYFTDHLGDPEGMAVSEVERYCASPGQACCYMVGKLTWLRLREEARRRLGARFDLRRFHDAALTAGSLPLDVLERQLATYS